MYNSSYCFRARKQLCTCSYSCKSFIKLTPGHILEKCSEINNFQSQIFSNSFLHRFLLSSPTKSKTTHHYRFLQGALMIRIPF